MNYEQDTYTLLDALTFDKQEQSNLNELPTTENRNSTPQNNTEQKQTQELKINLENMKRIINE